LLNKTLFTFWVKFRSAADNHLTFFTPQQ